jgi:hypothetical protein
MPVEVLKDLTDIAKRIKYKYTNRLNQMIFLFCYKRPDGKNFIFQELTAVPIQRFVYHPSNSSISLTAGWSAWGNPYSLVADGRHGGTEVWKDLFDRSKPNNTNINQFGTFNAEEWTLINRSNTHEEIKKKKTKFDTVFEFRTDKIERVCLYNRWFEVISSSLSFMAIDPFMIFPYLTDPPSYLHPAHAGYSLDEFEEDCDDEEVEVIRYNGRAFEFGVTGVQDLQHPQAYWDVNESDPANDEFDEYLIRKLVNGYQDIEGSIDVGQRKINLDFGE